jgi:hypothetical protein
MRANSDVRKRPDPFVRLAQLAIAKPDQGREPGLENRRDSSDVGLNRSGSKIEGAHVWLIGNLLEPMSRGSGASCDGHASSLLTELA